jgi:hypothetical protein
VKRVVRFFSKLLMEFHLNYLRLGTNEFADRSTSASAALRLDLTGDFLPTILCRQQRRDSISREF